MNRQQTRQNLRRLQSQVSQTSADILPDFTFKRESIHKLIKSIFKDNNMCIIRGQSGVGKSIMARRFAQDCVDQNVFKHVYEINAADDKIEASMRNFATGMGIVTLDENSNSIPLDHLFKSIVARIRQKGPVENNLLVFDDAQGKFLSRYYEFVKVFKTLVITKKKVYELKEFDQSTIVQLDSFTKKEGVSAIKQFFAHYDLQVSNEKILEEINDGLGGFPLAIFQVLKKIKSQVMPKAERGNHEPIDDIVLKGIEVAREFEVSYREDMAKEVDDPHLRKMTLIVKRIFESINENEQDKSKEDHVDGSKMSERNQISSAERLFLVLSLMDIDYLYQEMFQIKNTIKNKQYSENIEHLRNIGLIHIEQRYVNFSLIR